MLDSRALYPRALGVAGALPLALFALAACQPRPTTSASPARGTGPQAVAGQGQDTTERGRGALGEPSPRPYSRVITREAQSKDGLFRTHRIGSKLLYEIPRKEFGKEFLLVSQIARTTLGAGYGGQALGNRVLRWDRRGHRVLLRDISFEITADTTLPVYQAVQSANYNPILMAFNVEAYGADSAAVIDVTRLFTSDVPEMTARNRLRAGPLDAARTFVERVATFPDNIEVEATHTFAPLPQTPTTQQPTPPGQPPRRSESASVLMHWSMVRLPESPMMPRLYDDRVGYFSIRQYDYGREEHRAQQRRFITRWRLEKKDPAAEMSEPVKPIVYYVDPATPAKWVPWIKRGIEDWQRAFEAAGFRNAILAREAPSPAEDPDWSAEDARYSVVRWLPSTIENASGPHVHDPRTGEILESDIQFYHNVQNLLRDWYWVQVGALDPRARRLPLPDSLMGRLIQYVTAHEVGHTLGFQHNMKASSTYPLDSIRSASFLRRMGGHTPTLMDYSRFNYVAQPEDSIPLDRLIPDIGPYDKFATMWGYRPIPDAKTPDEERPTLDRWARMQDTIPWYRFSTSGSGSADPGQLTEAVGDADAVRATQLGLRNIQRLVPMLIPATRDTLGNYSDLAELYGRLLGQWATEMNHVAAIIGGVESREKYGSQEGVRFTPIPRARQVEAMRFLNQHAFRTPEFFLDQEILRRIEVEGAMERIRTQQLRVLSTLLNDDRLSRVIEFEALATSPREVYAIGDLMGDLRRGIWEELTAPRVAIDPFRRNLQRSYLELIDRKLNPPASQPRVVPGPGGQPTMITSPRPSNDARAFIRGELVELDAAIRAALSRTADRTTRLHLQDARQEIRRILDPDRRGEQRADG